MPRSRICSFASGSGNRGSGEGHSRQEFDSERVGLLVEGATWRLLSGYGDGCSSNCDSLGNLVEIAQCCFSSEPSAVLDPDGSLKTFRFSVLVRFCLRTLDSGLEPNNPTDCWRKANAFRFFVFAVLCTLRCSRSWRAHRRGCSFWGMFRRRNGKLFRGKGGKGPEKCSGDGDCV